MLNLHTQAQTATPTKRLTQAFVKKELQAVGCTFRKTDWEEFRVNVAGGEEATAYYTTCLDDALTTGKHMAAFAEKQAAGARSIKTAPTVTAAPKTEPLPVADDKTRYNLGSAELIHAPSIVRAMQNDYHFVAYRKRCIALIATGWNVPEAVAKLICEGKGEIVGNVYSIEV
jgi:hypothetical protein